jgi:hypothetical protein
MDEVKELKAKAEALAVDTIEWFVSEVSGSVVGVDWVGEDVYIIDPQSPDWPQIEVAQFEGVDQLYKEGK